MMISRVPLLWAILFLGSLGMRTGEEQETEGRNNLAGLNEIEVVEEEPVEPLRRVSSDSSSMSLPVPKYHPHGKEETFVRASPHDLEDEFESTTAFDQDESETPAEESKWTGWLGGFFARPENSPGPTKKTFKDNSWTFKYIMSKTDGIDEGLEFLMDWLFTNDRWRKWIRRRIDSMEGPIRIKIAGIADALLLDDLDVQHLRRPQKVEVEIRHPNVAVVRVTDMGMKFVGTSHLASGILPTQLTGFLPDGFSSRFELACDDLSLDAHISMDFEHKVEKLVHPQSQEIYEQPSSTFKPVLRVQNLKCTKANELIFKLTGKDESSWWRTITSYFEKWRYAKVVADFAVLKLFDFILWLSVSSQVQNTIVQTCMELLSQADKTARAGGIDLRLAEFFRIYDMHAGIKSKSGGQIFIYGKSSTYKPLLHQISQEEYDTRFKHLIMYTWPSSQEKTENKSSKQSRSLWSRFKSWFSGLFKKKRDPPAEEPQEPQETAVSQVRSEE